MSREPDDDIRPSYLDRPHIMFEKSPGHGLPLHKEKKKRTRSGTVPILRLPFTNGLRAGTRVYARRMIVAIAIVASVNIVGFGFFYAMPYTGYITIVLINLTICWTLCTRVIVGVRWNPFPRGVPVGNFTTEDGTPIKLIAMTDRPSHATMTEVRQLLTEAEKPRHMAEIDLRDRQQSHTREEAG